jgi:hypothetical protein
VERRQGGADRIGFASCCGKRTLGEQSVFRTMLTRRKIKDRALRRSAPSHFEGERAAELCAIIARRRCCMRYLKIESD